MAGPGNGSPTTAASLSGTSATRKSLRVQPATTRLAGPPERAVNFDWAKVRDASWHDHTCGQVILDNDAEPVCMPADNVETSTLAAYRSCLDHALHPPSEQADRQDLAVRGAAVTENGLGRVVAKYDTCCTRFSNAPSATRFPSGVRVLMASYSSGHSVRALP
jgi:hypothetical protein